MKDLYVNFGCGSSCPDEFTNYDGSFNLRLQRMFLIGSLVKKINSVHFPANALYADITRGLPVKENSLKGIFSSHVLEHLSLEQFRSTLANCYRYLQSDGIFRAVLPNLEESVNYYTAEKERGNKMAALEFMQYTFLGYEKRPLSFIDILKWRLSGHHHFWMWDYNSMEVELLKAGFKKVYKSGYHLSSDPYFNYAESENRFAYKALCVEAVK